MKRIYLDTAASTPVDRLVRKKMMAIEEVIYGNPSSIHEEGVLAKKIVAEARTNIAKILASRPEEIIFTSGGTASNNLAILGVADWYEKEVGKRGHIITSAIEHHSVLGPIEFLRERGWSVTVIPVGHDGLIKSDDVKKALKKNTVLVSIGYINNEIGTIAPIKDIAKIIRTHRKKNTGRQKLPYPYFHTDACQATRFLPLIPDKLGVDLMTANGSKMYGPKGVGLLFVRHGLKILPREWGGGQEMNQRSGTENVVGIAGLATAFTQASKLKEKEVKHLTSLRNYAIKKILTVIPEAKLNGSQTNRSPNNLNFTFPGALAELLVIELDAKGIAASTGSACATNTGNESHVIKAISDNEEDSLYSIRFTLGRETTRKDIDYLLKILPSLVKKLRLADQLRQSLL